jgi:hypothetical protein
VINDPPFDNFVGDLAIGPVGNGASRLAGSLTGHGHDRADLLGRNPGRLARAGRIAEAFFQAQLGQGDRLEEHPAFPPKPHRFQTDLARSGDGQVTLPRGGIEDDLGSQNDLLGDQVPTDQSLQGGVLFVGQLDGHRLGTTHDCRLERNQRGFQQNQLNPYYQDNYAKLH